MFFSRLEVRLSDLESRKFADYETDYETSAFNITR